MPKPTTASARPSRFVPLPLPASLRVPSCAPAGGVPPGWLAAGTAVAAGDALADAAPAAGPLPVAPVDGVVGDACLARLTDGRPVHAIQLRPAHLASPAEGEELAPPDVSAAAALLEGVSPADLGDWAGRARDAGLWADRWTCPDLLAQMHAALRRPVDRLVLNLLDSDPWLAANRAIVEAWPAEVAAGVGLLSRLAEAQQAWALFAQGEAPDHLAGLRDAAAALAPDLRLAPIENDYPQPDPTLAVYAATRRRLRPGRLPTDQGVLLVDAGAAAALGRLVLAAGPGPAPSPWVTRHWLPTVVYDQPTDSAHHLLVPPGTSVGFVLDQLGVPAAQREVYAGSPLRQVRVAAEDVLAGGGEATLFCAPPQPPVAPDPCVRCGWCIEACPTRCRPADLLEAAQRQDLDLARRGGLDACIECGLCTYVCPSRLPLLQGIRMIKRGEG